MPARLLRLRQLLHAEQQRQHPGGHREDRQLLPIGFLRLEQLLHQQSKQRPRGDPEDRQLLPAGLVFIWRLLRQEPVIAMGFRFRRSTRLGPLGFNFSKGGLS